MNSFEIQSTERAQKWLKRKELNLRAGSAKVIDPIFVIGILYANTLPDICSPLEPRRKVAKSFRPLGEDLELVPSRPIHDRENTLNERNRHIFVEQVAHGVDKNGARLLPPQRVFKSLIDGFDSVIPAPFVVDDIQVMPFTTW